MRAEMKFGVRWQRRGTSRRHRFSLARTITRPITSPRSGMAYVGILIMLLVLTSLSFAFINHVSIQRVVMGNQVPGMQAEYLAESAANHAMWLLLNDETFPASANNYYMHDMAGGRYGYKVRRHTETTFATIATVGATANNVVQHSYVLYVTPEATVLTNLLLVVSDPGAMTVQEEGRMQLITDWGYDVTLIDDDASQAEFDAAVADAAVAYVPSTIDATVLGTKLREAPVGVVIEMMMDDFGIANSWGGKVRDEIDIVDNSHYITSPFAAGLLTYLSSLQPVTKIDSGPAPGLLTLANVLNVGSIWKPALGVIETGGGLAGGGAAAGRRVQLPWGDSAFDIAALNADGLTIMQRSIEWVMGDPAPEVQVLLVVPDATTLTAVDSARKALLESWDYGVTLFTASRPEEDYVEAANSAAVVYISSSVPYTDVYAKPKLLTVGVVNEISTLSGYLGFTSGSSSFFGTQTEIVDNGHEITAPFSIGTLSIVSPYQTLRRFTNTIGPGLRTLSTRPATADRMIMTLETGDDILWGGQATGRRVMLPWCASTFNVSTLTADGKTLLKRALAWAATTPTRLLFVTADAGSLNAQDLAKQAKMESWDHTVQFISASDSQVNFDTAVANHDVVFISEDISSTTLGTKLSAATIGVVSEEDNLSDEFGMAASIVWESGTGLNIQAITHDIIAPFAPGNLIISSSSESLAYVSGALSPDLALLGYSANGPALVALDQGQATHTGGIAAGRRVLLPWGGDAHDINTLNADGLTIMQRALEWASEGGGSTSSGPDPELHVSDIAMASFKPRKDQYYATATVEIRDGADAPVEGVVVTGQWSGLSNTGIATTPTTDAAGKMRFQSTTVKTKGGTFTFTVTDAAKTDYTYNAALNAETSDSINVP
jgi:Tfp pilus assembly protein PilX